MSGLGGLNKSPSGVVIGLVQLTLPAVSTPEQLAEQTRRVCELVGKARRQSAVTSGFRHQSEATSLKIDIRLI